MGAGEACRANTVTGEIRILAMAEVVPVSLGTERGNAVVLKRVRFDVFVVGGVANQIGEIVDVVELFVDAGESNERDFIEFGQVTHDDFTDLL